MRRSDTFEDRMKRASAKAKLALLQQEADDQLEQAQLALAAAIASNQEMDQRVRSEQIEVQKRLAAVKRAQESRAELAEEEREQRNLEEVKMQRTMSERAFEQSKRTAAQAAAPPSPEPVQPATASVDPSLNRPLHVPPPAPPKITAPPPAPKDIEELARQEAARDD